MLSLIAFSIALRSPGLKGLMSSCVASGTLMAAMAQLGGGAVVVHLDVLHQCRRGPPGADAAQLVLQVLDGLLHRLLTIEQDVVKGHKDLTEEMLNAEC